MSAELRPGDDHSPRSAAVVLEITHATLGGLVPDFSAAAEVSHRARANGTAVHIDGARLFNAPGRLRDPGRALGGSGRHRHVLLLQGSWRPAGAGEASAFVGSLARNGVRAKTYGGRWVRLVTHKDVSDEDLHAALAAVERTVRHVLRS
ncbi:beta-eliminating lyase-related protein [Streptomyces sp. NPDC056159]|uniref:beta-eliminating lyase-related protein n=1 Tax=unclassified Streptomyces TaxID=2593676 RepID=UPI00343ACECB